VARGPISFAKSFFTSIPFSFLTPSPFPPPLPASLEVQHQGNTCNSHCLCLQTLCALYSEVLLENWIRCLSDGVNRQRSKILAVVNKPSWYENDVSVEVQLRAFLNVDSGGNEQFLRPGSIIRPVRSVQVPTGSDIGWADMNTVWKTIISGLIGNRTSIRSASWGGGGK
jgi:hypothetical protein